MIRRGRLYRYSAVHKLWSAILSENENRTVFGKCASPNGHGHTYVIELVVGCDEVDESGRVINPRELDRIAGIVLAPRFDHADLNKSFGPDFIPTGENLVEKVWELIEPQLSGVRLLEVEVEETPRNRFRMRHTDRHAADA